MNKCIVCNDETPLVCRIGVHNECGKLVCAKPNCQFEHMSGHLLSPLAEEGMRRYGERQFTDYCQDSKIPKPEQKVIMYNMIQKMKKESETIDPKCTQTLMFSMARIAYLNMIHLNMNVYTPTRLGEDFLQTSAMTFRYERDKLIASTQDTDPFKIWPSVIQYDGKDYEWAGRHIPSQSGVGGSHGEYELPLGK